jgi:hypothetical protein
MKRTASSKPLKAMACLLAHTFGKRPSNPPDPMATKSSGTVPQKKRILYITPDGRQHYTNRYDMGVLLYLIGPSLKVSGCTFVGYSD